MQVQTQTLDPSILTVCLDDAAGLFTGDAFRSAQSGQEAIELMRVLNFDLLVSSLNLPDMPLWKLVQTIRAAWPWQKWALVDAQIATADEIRARSLGAVALFDSPPPPNLLTELAGTLRRPRRAATSVTQEPADARQQQIDRRRRVIARLRHEIDVLVMPPVANA